MTARLPDPQLSRAVLIGTSRYADPELTDLRSVEANLGDLRQVLTSQRGSGLLEHNCTMLLDPIGTREVGRVLSAAAAAAEDMLLVYYAGHGLTWTDRNELYLSLSDTDRSEVGTSALRCAEVRHAFQRSRARIRVLILDCCFSGREIPDALTGVSDALLHQADVKGAYVLTAAGPNEVAKNTGGRNTAFTGEMMRLLHDGIPGGAELLTLDELYRHLLARMAAAGLPVPRSNSHDSAAHLALAHNAQFRPEAIVARLGASIEELGAAEERMALVRQRVRDRIRDAILPPLDERAAALRDRWARAQASADRQGWTPLLDSLKALQRECAEALADVGRRQDLAQGWLDRRDEQRSWFASLEVMARRKGTAEDPEICRARRAAGELLWARPCDLQAAETALRGYELLVIGRKRAA